MDKESSIQEVLPEGLKVELMPKHLAVILDGNRRWAKEKGLAVELGHKEGKRVMMELALLSSKWGIKVLSLFAFSTENWTRPKVIKYNVRLSFIGDRSKLPESLIELINSAEERTRSNKGLHVIVALNYSGRFDIMQATKSIASKVKDGILQMEDINETLFDEQLQTNCTKFPVPDLLIRTSGEQRISNFMLWQLAYTELFFSKKNFPDFEEQDFVEALVSFQQRDRRFGGNAYS
ncbi:hypothetical protein RD792_003071 [Penstemon davidsonii]|uniref:Alkyl transferase n=1 Tax=Penstemon davidsonii TaxID=160366 RepID=A0ABR0DTW9_9LAMI|nr:hypothetical protein RD792_003071 [Penstemon davidsonii]